jgi:hypothetical protein
VKATVEIPEELYRRVKAKSVLEGRPVRAVTEELFRLYVTDELTRTSLEPTAESDNLKRVGGEPVPSWFGMLRDRTGKPRRHDMEAIRSSIARGVASEREP